MNDVQPPLLSIHRSDYEKKAQLYRKIITTYIRDNVATIKNIIRFRRSRGYHTCTITIRDFNSWWQVNRIYTLDQELTFEEKVNILSRTLPEINKIFQDVHIIFIQLSEYEPNVFELIF